VKTPTQAQWDEANSHLPYLHTLCQDAGEVWCILDSVADDEDLLDNLEEYRFWHSPAGRQQEADEAFESGGGDSYGH